MGNADGTAGPARKLVIVAPNWLGDAVMSMPAAAAAGAVDGVVCAVLASPYTARVYAGADGVDEVIVDEGRGGRIGRIRWRSRALRAVGAEAVAVLPPSFSSALAPFFARVPARVGYGTDGRSVLLTEATVPPRRGSEHLSSSYHRLVQRAMARLSERGSDPAGDGTPPRLRVFEPDRREARAVLDRFELSGRCFIAVAPGATYGPAKSWPWERYREAASEIARDVPVVLVGGAAEREACARIAEGLPGVHNAAGTTSLGGFFALLSGAEVLLSNDSGPPHAAAALGVPVVVLFGSTSPEWTRPLGEGVTVLRHPVHCSPCFRRTCPTQLECFGGISTREAVEAVRGCLSSGAKKGVAETPAGR
jgi:heptosyltransferase-2